MSSQIDRLMLREERGRQWSRRVAFVAATAICLLIGATWFAVWAVDRVARAMESQCTEAAE